MTFGSTESCKPGAAGEDKTGAGETAGRWAAALAAGALAETERSFAGVVVACASAWVTAGDVLLQAHGMTSKPPAMKMSAM